MGLFGTAGEVTIGDNMAAHESEMVADDTPLRLPLKRSHSPGPGFGSELDPGSRAGSVVQRPTLDAWPGRTLKQFRRAKDLSAYKEAVAESHPLHKKTLKKTLKKDANKARRAARPAAAGWAEYGYGGGRVAGSVYDLDRRSTCTMYFEHHFYSSLDAAVSMNLASSTRVIELRATKTSTCWCRC